MTGLSVPFIKEVGVIKWDRVVVDKERMVPTVSQARQNVWLCLWLYSPIVCVSLHHSQAVTFSDVDTE